MGMGAASGLGPDDSLLSPRQRLFKELGERLLRLAAPHKTRIDLVDNLDDEIETLKQKVNVTETERKILQDRLAELEAANAAKNSISGIERQGKGAVLQYVSEQLEHVKQPCKECNRLLRELQRRRRRKKGWVVLKGERKGEWETTSKAAAEKPGRAESCYGHVSIGEDRGWGGGETPDTDDSDSGASEEALEEGVRPKTVADLAKATVETSSGSSSPETFATVVKDVQGVPSNEGDAHAKTSNSPDTAPQAPLQPVDPTTPGQKSVADQVFDALGGTETFSEAEKEESLSKESSSHLNSPTWKSNAEISNANAPASTRKSDSRGINTQKAEKTQVQSPASNEPVKSKAADAVPGIRLSTNNRESAFGPDEEVVARQEITGAAVDAKVAKARLEFAPGAATSDFVCTTRSTQVSTKNGHYARACSGRKAPGTEEGRRRSTRIKVTVRIS